MLYIFYYTILKQIVHFTVSVQYHNQKVKVL